MPTVDFPSRQPGDEGKIHVTLDGEDRILDRTYYRDSILLPVIQGTTDPQKLASFLRSGLDDKFGPDLLADAYRLTTIDPDQEQSYCLYASALIQAEDFDRASAVLDSYAQGHPPSPLVNSLRSTIAARKEDYGLALKWASSVLELDPNYPAGYWRLTTFAKIVGGEELMWQFVELAAGMGSVEAAKALAERGTQSPSS